VRTVRQLQVCHHHPGEMRQCIVLNCLPGATLENVVFDNVHATFGGGGTAEDARREVPQVPRNIS